MKHTSYTIYLLFVLAACWHTAYGSGPPLPPGGNPVTLTACEYWFDTNFSARQTAAIAPGQTVSLRSINLPPAVGEGVHTLHVRVQDSKDRWSVVKSQTFYKYPASQGGTTSVITACEHWFDRDYENRILRNVTTTGAGFSLSAVDVSACTEGIHTLNIRIRDDLGRWSVVQSQAFYKSVWQGGQTADITGYEYWFDTDFDGRVAKTVSPSGLLAISQMDVAACTGGIHTMHLRVKDNQGRWSVVQSQTFYRYPTSQGPDEANITAYEYWFDNNYEGRTVKTTTAAGVLAIDRVDVSACTEGFHAFHLRVKDDRGRWSVVQSQNFYKHPPVTTGADHKIIAYRYWFDKDFGSPIVVEQPQAVACEITAITVPAGLTDGSEHTLHLQFRDTQGLWSVVESQQFTMPEPPPANRADFDLLAAFYQSTGGSSWTSTAKQSYLPWDTADPASKVYAWHGVTTRNGMVSDINLPANNLTGSVPDLSAWSQLASLHLQGNSIRTLNAPLPATLTAFNIESQVLDMGTLDLPATGLQLDLPNICLYHHSEQNFAATPQFEVFIDDRPAGTVTAVADKVQLGSMTSTAAVNSFVTLLQKDGDAKGTILTWRGSDMTLRQLNLQDVVVAGKIYDGTTEGRITNHGALSGVAYGHEVSVDISGATAVFASPKAATGIAVTISGITLKGKDAEWYVLLQPKDVKADISPKEVTVTGITVKEKVYDGAIAAEIDQAGTLTGVLEGDEVTADMTGVTATYNDARAGSTRPATVTGIGLQGADAANYTLPAQQATGRIAKADVTLTDITIRDKEYDGTVTAYIGNPGTLAGVVAGDQVAPGAVTARYENAGVGENKPVNVTQVALTGNDAGNYNLKEWPATHTASVTPHIVTVSGITIKEKVYDGTLSAEIEHPGALSWKASTDDVSPDMSAAVAAFINAFAGTQQVTVTGITLTGGSSANYTLWQPSGVTGIIARAVPEITVPPAVAPITDGQMLRRALFTGGQTSVPGRFVFDQPDQQPAVGTLAHTAWFIPDNSNYESVSFNVNVAVVAKPYTITAQAGKLMYTSGEQAVITGKVVASGAQSVSGITVDVHVDMTGYRRTITATTDASGNFSAVFTPQNDEAGHYYVICNVRDELSDIVNCEFDIIGMRLATSGWITWEVEQGKAKTGSISIQNRTGKELNNLTVEIVSGTPNAEIVFEPLATLPGNGTVAVNYTVTGINPTVEAGAAPHWEELQLKAVSAEGAACTFNIWFYCSAPKAALEAIPGNISASMVQGKPKTIGITLVNNGEGATGAITVSIPQTRWMELVSPRTMPSLAPKDTTLITLRLNADKNVALGPYTGTIAVNCDNGASVSVPFDIKAVTENTGKLIVDVVDEYYYNTTAAPHVAGATVTVRDYFSGETVAEGFTGTDGLFVADKLPEGYYKLHVSAEKHESRTATIMVDAGKDNFQQIFISFQAITYSWKVIPTEIEDQYDIDLVVEFETNVPAPVVTIEVPDSLPKIRDDEVYHFNIVLTNHGLINANDVVIEVPTINGFTFTAMIDQISILEPKASIVIPIIFKKGSSAFTIKSMGEENTSNPCIVTFGERHHYKCGNDRKWHFSRSEPVRFNKCAVNAIIDAIIDAIAPLLPDISGGGGSGGNGGSGGISEPPPPPRVTVEPRCFPCEEHLLGPIIACGPDILGLINPLIGYFFAGMAGVECVDAIFQDISMKKKILTCGNIYLPVDCVRSLGPLFRCISDKYMSTKRVFSIVDDYERFIEFLDSRNRIILEYLENKGLVDKEHYKDFYDAILPFLLNEQTIDDRAKAQIKQILENSDITNAEVDNFVLRWNTTIEAWSREITSPNNDYPNIVDKMLVNELSSNIQSVFDYSVARGFESPSDMIQNAMDVLQLEYERSSNSVCASVTLQLSQRLTMTREAFRGTLTLFNGHESSAMEDVNLILTVKDEDGNDCTSLFQINTEKLSELTEINGTGMLAAQAEGIATILFIPKKEAAPTVSKKYYFGGELIYKDPFTGESMSIRLFPAQLDVHPSPILHLHYFMQRDILADDPLTEAIEPIIPAELAVLIDNRGYGEAKKVTIESAQPQIIENEKGLLIDFKLIGSNLNGQPAQLGLTNINFGNIAPLSQVLGQWWLTSSLLGHFTTYETRVSHLNSYGNPELSLIEEVKAHELIRSIKGYSEPYKGVTAFLVNDVPDAEDLPYAIWFADGKHSRVQPAVRSTVEGTLRSGNTMVTLLVEAKSSGWSYTKTDDPGNGKYRLVSVTREGGQSIPLSNVWQTHCTLPDGGDPVYENKLHLVDTFARASLVAYTLEFEEAPQMELHVLAINGIPSVPVTQPLGKVEVVFNKPVKEGTFDWLDLDLCLPDGKNLVTSAVTVTRKDDVTWEIDLSAVTQRSGQYTFTVNTDGISDTDGQYGQYAVRVSWMQLLSQNITKEQQSICEGEVYHFHGQALDKSGSYYHIEYETSVENITQLDLTVHPIPTVSLGNNRTVQGLSVELDAGEGFASYLWSTGATGQKIAVSGADGEVLPVSVTVTNTHGCPATAEVSITFEARTFTVSFDTQGGNVIVPLQVKEGARITRPAPDPERTGFVFDGWYKEAVCTNAWDFDTDIISGDITLYAKWNKVTGISDPERLEALVYPNPAQHGKAFYIQLEFKATGSTLVEVFNASGQLLSKTIESDDPIRLAAPDVQGSYYIRLTNGKQTQTYKLVVE